MSEDKTIAAQRKAYIDVFVANPNMRDPMGHVDTALKLPVSAGEFADALKHIGVTDPSGKDYYFHSMGIWDYSLRKHFPRPDLENFEELNYLAAKIQGLGEHGLDIFAAVMETGKYCDGSIKDIINIVENVNCFDLLPFHNETEYGEYLTEHGLDDHSEALSALEDSDYPEDHALAEYIKRIHDFLIPEALGKDTVASENGVFTQNGYLTGGEGFQEVYISPDDIPDQWRVLALTNAVPLLKVENVDLTALLLEMHALGGNYDFMSPNDNMNVLASRRSTDYIVLMEELTIYVTEAEDAYHCDKIAYNILTTASKSPDTRAFFIHITDIPEPHGGAVGSVVEVDFAELQRDIAKHHINYTRVDTMTMFGSGRSYTPEEWNAKNPVDRHMGLERWTRHYEHDDLQAVVHHLNHMREKHEHTGRVVEPEVLLSDLNRAYMKKAENPQPDMLRITHRAAKELLARGDCAVYRLLPEGAAALSPIEAIRNGLDYGHYREFAIKREDLAGLNRWVERNVVDSVKRTVSRSTPEKSKNNGPEH